MLTQIGKGVLRREGKDVALIGYGTMVQVCATFEREATRQLCSLHSCCLSCALSMSSHQHQPWPCIPSFDRAPAWMQTCMAAAEQLAKSGIEATVMDARFCKPLDEGLIRKLAHKHPVPICHT